MYPIDIINIAHRVHVKIGAGSHIQVNGKLNDNMPVIAREAERLKTGQGVRHKLKAEIAKTRRNIPVISL